MFVDFIELKLRNNNQLLELKDMSENENRSVLELIDYVENSTLNDLTKSFNFCESLGGSFQSCPWVQKISYSEYHKLLEEYEFEIKKAKTQEDKEKAKKRKLDFENRKRELEQEFENKEFDIEYKYKRKIKTLEKENSHLYKIIDKFYETVDKFIVWICNKFGIGESKQLIKDFEKQTNTFIDPVKQLECEEREKECDLEL